MDDDIGVSFFCCAQPLISRAAAVRLRIAILVFTDKASSRRL
jgi:hypothetical protein